MPLGKRGSDGWKRGSGREVLVDVYASRVSGFGDKLVCTFKKTVERVGNGNQEFINYTDGSAFL